MSDDHLIEVYRRLNASQEKYVYFMLAASASAIAYALNRAQDRSLSTILIPWGLALLFWGLSFYFGCIHLAYVNSTLFANFELIRVQKGMHPEAGTHPQIIEAASDGIRSAIESNSKKANRQGHLQFWFFILGVLAYITWQILEMYVRSAQG
jgi:hypothetical protein